MNFSEVIRSLSLPDPNEPVYIQFSSKERAGCFRNKLREQGYRVNLKVESGELTSFFVSRNLKLIHASTTKFYTVVTEHELLSKVNVSEIQDTPFIFNGFAFCKFRTLNRISIFIDGSWEYVDLDPELPLP